MRLSRIALLAVSALLAGGLLAGTGSVASAASNTPCGTGKLVVNVNYTLVNDYDSGVAGNAWANDTINRHLQVWTAGAGSYCATVNDTGSFVTFAGTSPSGLGAVSAGISGVINGGYTSTTFTGTLSSAPAYAARGNLGTFDLACTDAYNCPGAHPSFLSYFSANAWDGNLASWGWTYHTAQHGNWVNAATGNSGDITG